MSVAPIKLTKEINDVELVEHFNNARLSERLLLLERLDNKLAKLSQSIFSKEEVFEELSSWISEVKPVANSSTENKEAK
ncbi:TPA: hypothetical protein ACV1O4_003605 [Yersinia enterocolitica]|uniref:hypothetical protein n=1 Tax=Yersinia enterocolitica TaxID=630 RepID=UPI0021E83103|nr:hypothetical protein [Yersinia enterocolitica]UYK06563.1 hypothetical protein N4218_01575 [Yersinia enterocolitica]HDL6713241.1 hypothetical protein [Yersinia enterocolitica]HDL7087047.1 hypothetical protein [Yersinia enterocolitica]HDL7415472.1 hypothetical protein [Yersinia enterocolitica]HDU2638478.1 hypothetical protein [Yersinia enterocolitica]